MCGGARPRAPHARTPRTPSTPHKLKLALCARGIAAILQIINKAGE